MPGLQASPGCHKVDQEQEYESHDELVEEADQGVE